MDEHRPALRHGMSARDRPMLAGAYLPVIVVAAARFAAGVARARRYRLRAALR
jgi:hypothetical protein